MSAVNSSEVAPASIARVAARSPAPQAGSAPRAPSPAAAGPDLGFDRIGRPVAQAPRAPAPLGAPSSSAGIPVLVAAGLLAGEAAVALPALEIAGGMVATGARTVGAALAKTGPYATTALRDFAAKYGEGAGHLREVKFGDPHVLGETLGAQAWTATEEVARSMVVGAGLGGGAWAAQKMCSAVADAIAHRPSHAAQR